MPRGYEIIVIDANGKSELVRFSSETKLVKFLQATRDTHAPISFARPDGSTLDRATMERIHKCFFAE
jgi:hypothetical protein